MKKYTFADLADPTKPRITKVRRTYGTLTYSWECKGRGSVGFGFTPAHAYQHWYKNWKRRYRFYGGRERWACESLAFHPRH